MMDANPFFAEILAAPDDDTPRLVWADWLEERGDPRGEFVRAQCAAARLPAWDLRRRELERRAAQLWSEQSGKWLAELPTVRGAQWGRFERGMPSKLVVWDCAEFHGDVDVALAVAVAPQFQLSFGSGALPPDVTTAGECRWLSEATGLSLPVGSPEVVVAMLRHVRSDRFRRLSFEGEERAARTRSVLRAGNWGHIPSVIARLRLSKIAFARCEAWPAIEHADGLNCLRLTDCDFLSERELAGNLAFESLQQLSLTDQFLLRAIECIAVGRAMQGLRSLHLAYPPSALPEVRLRGGARLTTASMNVEMLTAARSLPELVDLKLDRTDLEDAGLTTLAEAPGLQNLRSLALPESAIGPAGVQALAASPLLGRLEALDLSHNPLGDAAALALANTRHGARLRHLNLRHTQITDTGALALAQSEQLPQLQSLHLSTEHLSPHTRKALRRIRQSNCSIW